MRMDKTDLIINRRVALQLMATAGVSLSSMGCTSAKTLKKAAPVSDINSNNTDIIGATGTRFNLQEAERVMQTLGVDALILGEGRNFQQATGCLPVIANMGWPALNLAILLTKPEPKVITVMLGFSYYYMASDLKHFSEDDVFLYTFNQIEDQTEALDSVRFFDRGEAPLSDIEKRRVLSTKSILEQKELHHSLGGALQAALKSADILNGRLAFDNPYIELLLTKYADNATLTSADDALRRIRTIKSPIEIELMRASSQINISSALAALKQIGAGASHKDLRRAYYSELSLRDANGVFMVIDHVSDEQFDADLVNGQTFLIDCVGEHLGYLGDYGRTVFIGEPEPSAIKAQNTVAKAWDSLRNKLKPGITFSDIEKFGQKAMSEQGTTYRVPFKPHSVGVFHSDHLGNGSSPPREDIVLRPGMIISIDCPVLERGIGGSVHLEDLMLITNDGAEPIHDIGHQAIIL